MTLSFNSWLALSHNEKTIQWIKLRNCDVTFHKGDTSPRFSLCIFPNFRYLSKYFAQIYRAQYGVAILVFLHGTPKWWPKNSVNIWNLLWLSRRLIIYTEQRIIYILSTFPNTLTSGKAKNHNLISIYFATNAFVAFCHTPQ